MILDCYKLHSKAPKLIPARPERPWMDATADRFAYRCTPLTMANSTGWEILCPDDILLTWSGGRAKTDLTIEYQSDPSRHQGWAQSHFGHGIVSFMPGYLFRTEPGWGVWSRGTPNRHKEGVVPLEGLVETDWLPFTFTMNWRLTRAGRVRFTKGEPFCFVIPIPHMMIEAIRPQIIPISDAPALMADYTAWRNSRDSFNDKLATKDEGALREKWQRYYLKGQPPQGDAAPPTHRIKRRMAEPIETPPPAFAEPSSGYQG